MAFDELSKKSDEQIASLKTDNAKVKKLLDDLHAKDADSAKRNEVPDGKIVTVNQRTRLVWINRGSADGLRRQTSFSVFDADDSNPLEATLKGKIEVVRMINDHMAEARIVEDDLSNPMMSGDPIFSPSWEPGRPEHFALAGFMDIDDDGQSDRQRIRDLICHQRRRHRRRSATKPAKHRPDVDQHQVPGARQRAESAKARSTPTATFAAKPRRWASRRFP